MNWTYLIIGLVLLLGFFAVVGLVKSVLRLIIAGVAGILAALITSWILQAFSLSESAPQAIVLASGALAALSVLLKKR